MRILCNVRAAARTGKWVLLVEFVIPNHDREFLGKWLDLTARFGMAQTHPLTLTRRPTLAHTLTCGGGGGGGG